MLRASCGSKGGRGKDFRDEEGKEEEGGEMEGVRRREGWGEGRKKEEEKMGKRERKRVKKRREKQGGRGKGEGKNKTKHNLTPKKKNNYQLPTLNPSPALSGKFTFLYSNQTISDKEGASQLPLL